MTAQSPTRIERTAAAPPVDPRVLLAESQMRQAAAIVEITTRCLAAASVRSALDSLAADIEKLFDARTVAIGLVRRSGPRCRLVAQSGLSDVARDTNAGQAIETAMAEATLDPSRVTVWSRGAIGESVAKGHEPLAERWNSLVIASAATRPQDEADVPVAVITVVDPPPHRAEELVRFLDAASGPLDVAIRTLRERDRSLRHRAKRLVGSPRLGGKVVATLLAASAIVAIASWPVAYRIPATCRTEPVLRRFVVAPHEGLVENGLAEVGESVVTGQTLAAMDGRDLQWEREGLAADALAAAKRRDLAMAGGDVPAAQEAELERLAVAARQATLDRKIAALSITSPIAGVVLDAAIERGSSQPVDAGDSLYEVGTIAPLRIETEVPADLWSHLRIGQTVELSMDGCPGERFTATLTRLRPELEQRDGRSVLVADAEIANDDRRLRPGMTGSARVVGARHPLIWTLTHRFGERLAGWLW